MRAGGAPGQERARLLLVNTNFFFTAVRVRATSRPKRKRRKKSARGLYVLFGRTVLVWTIRSRAAADSALLCFQFGRADRPTIDRSIAFYGDTTPVRVGPTFFSQPRPEPAAIRRLSSVWAEKLAGRPSVRKEPCLARRTPFFPPAFATRPPARMYRCRAKVAACSSAWLLLRSVLPTAGLRNFTGSTAGYGT